MNKHTLATFATGMRAASLIEDLANAGILATTFQPAWTNKKLPPPRIEVKVSEADAEAAKVVLVAFNAPRKVAR